MGRRKGSVNFLPKKKKGDTITQLDQMSYTTASGGGLNAIGIAFKIYRCKEETDDQLRKRIEIAIRGKR